VRFREPLLSARAMTVSATHLVLLPAYNTGPRLREVVTAVLQEWQPVLVIDDGSTDGSGAELQEMVRAEPALTVLTLPRNSGKGAAVLAGARAARERGFTHALVMDADGQHPAESIGEFMAASRRRPEALVLGRPVFPANIPVERLHGRKLSVGLVRFELFGRGVPDPLFGFRVYPLVPLLAALGGRRGGRRYDFDTEAAVRLCWAGVPPLDLAAPVRYFSRAEGGVSHFHYLRDNLTLVWMHTRLITELLLVRWPVLLRHRRHWRAAAVRLALLLVCAGAGHAAEPDPLVNPAHLLAPGAPAWSDLAEAFAHQADVTADFTEHRFFPFKKDPVELTGEVRVSAARGLSLHYLTPEERIVILDAHGVLIRGKDGQTAAPADPRAASTNDALLHILHFDFGALGKDFELYGQREAGTWTLVLVPRTEAQRRTIGRITVAGSAGGGTGPASVRRIELRRSARQAIEILIAPPRPPAPFSAAELKRFFR
jgi:glycosyltransferase involved in cell wall biosynthesis